MLRRYWMISFIFLAILTGCSSVKSYKSDNNITASETIKVLDVYWNPVLPANIQITRSARGYQPYISEADKRQASVAIADLRRIFSAGFTSTFSNQIKSMGVQSLEVVTVRQERLPNPVPGRYQLFVDVTATDLSCVDHGCTATFTLFSVLRPPASSEVAWSSTAKVGQSAINIPIDYVIFNAYSDRIMSDLKSKGYLR
jgi:hypothetical protein